MSAVGESRNASAEQRGRFCRGACAEVLSAVLPARSAKPEIQRLVSTEENVAPA
jgi:hypothetical protein